MKKHQLFGSLLLILCVFCLWSTSVSAENTIISVDQQSTSVSETPTPTPRRATHTPEPLPGEVTPTPEGETEGNGMTGYYISFGVLIALMVLNRVLAVRDKRNRPSGR